MQGVLRAPAEGEGGVAHREDLAATASATLERSTAVRWLMARGRRASGVAAAPRSRATGAPATRRRRAVGGACACRARSNGRRRPLVVVVVVVVRTPTPKITSGRLPLIGGSIWGSIGNYFLDGAYNLPHLFWLG